MRAYSLIRAAPWYRREAFSSGLKTAGFEVLERHPDRGRPGDVLVIWNRYGGNHDIASHFEKAGGRVIVAENGYLGSGGSSPKFDVHPAGPQPNHYYALALHGHNGQGEWPSGGPDRLERLALTLAPLRAEGSGHILICPNRPFGIPGRHMPADWADKAAQRLAKEHPGREIRIRRHPGNDRPKRDLALDLAGAWAVVVWTSNAGLHALVHGVPVLCDAPHWIGKPAAGLPGEDWERLRLETLIRVSWAQWRVDEIERGEPFIMLTGGGA
jgi:hypothetical protein